MAFWTNPSELFPKQSHRWVITYNNMLSGKTSVLHQDRSLTYYFAKAVDKPSYEIGSVQAKYMYNHTVNFPKRLQWKPIKLEIVDVNHRVLAGPETVIEMPGESIPTYGKKTKYLKSSQLFFFSFLRKAGYADPDEGKDSFNNLLTNRSYNFKKNMTKAFIGEEFDILEDYEYQSSQRMYIHELNENGFPMEVWEINNPLVTSVSFGRLDYSSDNVLSINVDLAYDWAKLIVVDEVKPEDKPLAQSRAAEPAAREQAPGFSATAFFGSIEVNGDIGEPNPNTTEILYGRTKAFPDETPEETEARISAVWAKYGVKRPGSSE